MGAQGPVGRDERDTFEEFRSWCIVDGWFCFLAWHPWANLYTEFLVSRAIAWTYIKSMGKPWRFHVPCVQQNSHGPEMSWGSNRIIGLGLRCLQFSSVERKCQTFLARRHLCDLGYPRLCQAMPHMCAENNPICMMKSWGISMVNISGILQILSLSCASAGKHVEVPVNQFIQLLRL